MRRHTSTLYIQAMPADTKNAFKAACYRRGETMRDVLITLMRSYVTGDPPRGPGAPPHQPNRHHDNSGPAQEA